MTFKPTDELREIVESMSGVGIPQDSIALVLDIAPKTLRKHFRAELDTAAIKANAKVGGTLFAKATSGDTTAAIFWAKTRMGWREKDVTLIGGDPDNPLVFNVITGVPERDS